MIADNDDIMDAPNMFTENTKPVMRVNQLLFTTLCGLFSWKGLQQEGNKEVLLCKILKNILIDAKLLSNVTGSLFCQPPYLYTSHISRLKLMRLVFYQLH